jgi:hypothetical protein
MFPVHAATADSDLDFGQKFNQTTRKQEHRDNKEQRNRATKINREELANKQQDDDEADGKRAGDAQCRRPVAVLYPTLKEREFGNILMTLNPRRVRMQIFQYPRAIYRSAEPHPDYIQDAAQTREKENRRDCGLDCRCDCIKRHIVLPMSYASFWQRLTTWSSRRPRRLGIRLCAEFGKAQNRIQSLAAGAFATGLAVFAGVSLP